MQTQNTLPNSGNENGHESYDMGLWQAHKCEFKGKLICINQEKGWLVKIECKICTNEIIGNIYSHHSL